MANDDDDLFEEEFDFVDEDDSEIEEEEPTKPKPRSTKASDSKDGGKRGAKKTAAAEDDDGNKDDGNKEDAEVEAEPEEAAEPPGPPTDHVVHVYEFGDFKRTIQREFTDEDSIKFAEEFNRTSKSHSRRAVPDHRDEKPDPHL